MITSQNMARGDSFRQVRLISPFNRPRVSPSRCLKHRVSLKFLMQQTLSYLPASFGISAWFTVITPDARPCVLQTTSKEKKKKKTRKGTV